MSDRVAVLIVTYNRIEKLKKSLESYFLQTKKPNIIFVVDNNSNDGTKEFLEEWKKTEDSYLKNVISLDRNIGGSGGFYEGIKAISDYDYDWLWIADDDAYPYVDAIEKLLKKTKSCSEYSVICASVFNNDGIDLAHRKIASNFILGESAPKRFYEREYFDICGFSFVGVCLKKEVVTECGLPIRDFFIWYDDTEYSLRVNQKFKMMCVPEVKVFHDTIIEKEWRYTWKTYYGERNKLYTLQKHLSNSAFRKYLLHFRLGMVKHYFTDHKYYLSQRDGYRDFKKEILGVPDDHLPGKFKY